MGVLNRHVNDTKDLQVRLTYSNSALLEKMQVHIVDENPPAGGATEEESGPGAHAQGQNPFGTFELGEEGAYLMPYEKLINPDIVKHKPLCFRMERVKEELNGYQGSGNPTAAGAILRTATIHGQFTNGTTSNFFATMTVRPGNIVDRPHRHAASAINYYFSGSGYSTVGESATTGNREI